MTSHGSEQVQYSTIQCDSPGVQLVPPFRGTRPHIGMGRMAGVCHSWSFCAC